MKGIENNMTTILRLFVVTCFFIATQANAGILDLALDELCSKENTDVYKKQLCIEPLHSKAQLIERKYTSAAARIDGFDRLKEFYGITSNTKAQIRICSIRNVNEYADCIDKVLNEARGVAEDKYSTARTTDFEHYNVAENIRSAVLNYTDIVLEKKLNEIKSCRIDAANRLDDNISAASDIANAVQAKCRVLAEDFYDMYFISSEPKELFDIFYLDSMASAIKYEQKQKLKETGIERWYGQQATIELVLEQRANRRATETQKATKPKNNSKKVQS